MLCAKGCGSMLQAVRERPAPLHCLQCRRAHAVDARVACFNTTEHIVFRKLCPVLRAIVSRARAPSLALDLPHPRMKWACKTDCRAYCDLLFGRWRDVPNWRDWDPDIESSALQVVVVVVLADWSKLTLSHIMRRKALHLGQGPRAPSNSEEETLPTSVQRIERSHSLSLTPFSGSLLS